MLELALAALVVTILGLAMTVYYGETARRHRCHEPIKRPNPADDRSIET